MWQQLSLIGLYGSLLAVALWLASRLGKRQSQVEALREEIKREIRERERKNEIDARVDNMCESDVRKRLQDTKNK